MTYDARNSTGMGGRENLIFAVGTLVLIAVVFLFALKGPDLFAGTSSGPEAELVEATGPLTRLSDEASKAYFAVLEKADPATFEALRGKIAVRPDATEAHLQKLVIDAAADVSRRNQRTLYSADVKHVDAILDLTRDGLTAAKNSASKYCRGSFYTSMAELNPDQSARYYNRLFLEEPALYTYGIGVNTIIAQAIIDAKANPVKHGALTEEDEGLMQGLVTQMLADRDIQPLLMVSNDDAQADRILRRTNVCSVGLKLVDALRALPEDTRGRFWAALVAQSNQRNGLASVEALAGF